MALDGVVLRVCRGMHWSSWLLVLYEVRDCCVFSKGHAKGEVRYFKLLQHFIALALTKKTPREVDRELTTATTRVIV